MSINQRSNRRWCSQLTHGPGGRNANPFPFVSKGHNQVRYGTGVVQLAENLCDLAAYFAHGILRIEDHKGRTVRNTHG